MSGHSKSFSRLLRSNCIAFDVFEPAANAGAYSPLPSTRHTACRASQRDPNAAQGFKCQQGSGIRHGKRLRARLRARLPPS